MASHEYTELIVQPFIIINFFQLQMYQTNLNICDKLKVSWVVVVISAVALYVLSSNFRSYLSVKWIIMHQVSTVKFLAMRLFQCHHIFISIEYLNLVNAMELLIVDCIIPLLIHYLL